MSRPGGRGPVLPYRPLAGVVPCPGGWLVAPGRLQGVTLSPADPTVLPTLIDVLDYKPAYEIIALATPVGLLDEHRRGGRTCEREARRLLGPRRGAAIASAPSRSALAEAAGAPGLSAVARLHLRSTREAAEQIQPYWQRTVYEVHPELSFYQLNGDQPLSSSKRTPVGRKERRDLLEARLPGVQRLLDARLPGARDRHLIDAAACLWTARRVAGRAVQRLPDNPEWDSQGLRMEFVR